MGHCVTTVSKIFDTFGYSGDTDPRSGDIDPPSVVYFPGLLID